MPIAENIQLPQKEKPKTSWVKRLLFPVAFVGSEVKRLQPDVHDYFLLLIVLGCFISSLFNQAWWVMLTVFFVYILLYAYIKSPPNPPPESGRS